jgi:tetratricopeptide (TPR) repeat protein
VSLDAAGSLFEQGDWERAMAALNQLLEAGALSRQERSRARKFVGVGHVLLGEEEKAVEVFKELVRDDPDFGMAELALDDEEHLTAGVRYFGQAILEVRQEELRAYEVRLRQTSRRGAFLRSAVLPGWGQRYQGYRNRGWTMLGMVGASLGYAALAERSYREARDAYDEAPLNADFDALYEDYVDKADRADLALGIFGAVWLVNVIDAATQGPNISRSQVGLKFRETADRRGLQLIFLKAF